MALETAQSELAQLNKLQAEEVLKLALTEGTKKFEAARIEFNKSMVAAKTHWDAMVAEAKNCPQLVKTTFPKIALKNVMKLEGLFRVEPDSQSGKYTHFVDRD